MFLPSIGFEEITDEEKRRGRPSNVISERLVRSENRRLE